MMPGFFDEGDIFTETEMGYGALSNDPILGLPQTPYLLPIQDPAQEAFQFPFQFPSQDASGGEGGQYAPVDVPENELQETPEQSGFNWADSFNPNASLVSNIIDISKGMAEQQGFDFGVFGELNLNQSLLSNVWNISKAMMTNEELQENPLGDLSPSEALGNAFDLNQFDFNESESKPLFTDLLGESQVETANLIDVRGFDAPSKIEEAQSIDVSDFEIGESAKEFTAALTESPVVAQATTLAETGADRAATNIVTGEVAEAAGLDIAPSIGELLDLAASLLL